VRRFTGRWSLSAQHRRPVVKQLAGFHPGDLELTILCAALAAVFDVRVKRPADAVTRCSMSRASSPPRAQPIFSYASNRGIHDLRRKDEKF
jgi:hypothetical protein